MQNTLSRILESAGLPEAPSFVATCIQTRSESLSSVEAVRETLNTFHPVEGWMLDTGCSSPLLWLTNSTPDCANLKHPLCGQFIDAYGCSLHIEQDGAGAWSATQLSLMEDPEACLCIRELLASNPSLGKLRYEVCYRNVAATAHQELRPSHYRFIGFSKENH